MQIQFLGTQRRRNPQQNYSRISTVGTPTFLGPGRVCCLWQLRIRPGPQATGACWDRACVLPTYHTPYLCIYPLSLIGILVGGFLQVPSAGDARKVGSFGTRAVSKNLCFCYFSHLFSYLLFYRLFLDSASLFGSLFGVFSCFVHDFFE